MGSHYTHQLKTKEGKDASVAHGRSWELELQPRKSSPQRKERKQKSPKFTLLFSLWAMLPTGQTPLKASLYVG